MNGRRLILLVGAILFVAGVIGLFVPVSISGGIGCGNAVHSDVSAARAQDNQNIGNSPVVQQIPIANQLAPKSQFVSECNSALGNRRCVDDSLDRDWHRDRRCGVRATAARIRQRYLML